jgi:hypothetical protein
MGSADNNSYKNQYHFTNKYRRDGDDHLSINDEPKINSVIKENPYKSNVEIEGKEIVLQPDLSALFKAVGKKHSKGGMDVFLKPDSFIFSDDKTLALNKNDHELFELKQGGKTFNPTKNTPAAVLKRNIDPTHYNTLVNNLKDPFKDELAKKSSARMLEKYIQTLGNIAYIQEEKKDFPEGLPDFSMGTAPVYSTETKDAVAESKQYRKYGGHVENTYLPKLQRAGIYRGINNMFDIMNTPIQPATTVPVMQTGTANVKTIDPITGETQYLPPYTPPMPTGYGTPAQLQSQLSDYNRLTGNTVPLDKQGLLKARRDVIQNYPEFVEYYYGNQKVPINNSLYNRNKALKNYTRDELLSTYEDLPKGAKDPLYGNELIDYQKLNFTSQKEYDDFIKGRTPIKRGNTIIGYDDPSKKGRFYIPSVTVPSTTPQPPAQAPTPDAPPETLTPNSGDGIPQTWKQVDWQFTPWQKISQAWNWGNYANVKRHMPFRSRFNATYLDPALLNEQQAVGTAKGVFNAQLDSLRTQSPILRNAQAAVATGQLMGQLPQIGLQVEAQNVGIRNQAQAQNVGIRNQESQINMQNDQQYYQQAVLGRQNFENMRTYTANNAMNNVLRDVETNQRLAYNELTTNNPAYRFDFRTGNFLRNPSKSIMDVQGRLPQDSWDAMVGQVQNLKRSGLSDQVISALVRGQFFKQAAPYFQNSTTPPPFPYRKGGTYRPKSRK